MKNSIKNSIECNSIEEYCSDVCKLEVDREYLDELHELPNDYPLAPEKLETSDNRMSNYCSNIANKHGIKIGGVNELFPDVGNKSKHVLQYKNPQLYLSLGTKLTKALKNLKFKQIH